ncbi:MAG TPA: hypothetical protein PLK82_08665 [Bacteroidales bacterium]|nr:hypothetical protein [Bacteroidales bacterium]
MKTVNFFRCFAILFIVVLFATFSSQAAVPYKSATASLQKMIREQITYPEQAVKNCCEGTVTVFFGVDEDGKIIIEKTIADNPSVDKLVKDQLSQVCCKDLDLPSYEHYKVSITFKLL